MKNSRWIVAAVYVATIFLTIPFTSHVWFALSDRTRLSPTILSIIILSAAAVAILAIVFRGPRPSARRIGGLLLVCGVYGCLLLQAFIEPIERVHLVEYGVLPWLIWRAMGQGISLYRVAAVWVLSADVGVFDELIQHFTPGRFGELRDVLINWESSALGMVIVAIAVSKNGKLETRI